MKKKKPAVLHRFFTKIKLPGEKTFKPTGDIYAVSLSAASDEMASRAEFIPGIYSWRVIPEVSTRQS